MGLKSLLVGVNLKDKNKVAVMDMGEFNTFDITGDEALLLSEGSDNVLYRSNYYKKVADKNPNDEGCPNKIYQLCASKKLIIFN